MGATTSLIHPKRFQAGDFQFLRTETLQIVDELTEDEDLRLIFVDYLKSAQWLMHIEEPNTIQKAVSALSQNPLSEYHGHGIQIEWGVSDSTYASKTLRFVDNLIGRERSDSDVVSPDFSPMNSPARSPDRVGRLGSFDLRSASFDQRPAREPAHHRTHSFDGDLGDRTAGNERDYADMGQVGFSPAQTIALLVAVVLPVFAESRQYRQLLAGEVVLTGSVKGSIKSAKRRAGSDGSSPTGSPKHSPKHSHKSSRKGAEGGGSVNSGKAGYLGGDFTSLRPRGNSVISQDEEEEEGEDGRGVDEAAMYAHPSKAQELLLCAAAFADERGVMQGLENDDWVGLLLEALDEHPMGITIIDGSSPCIGGEAGAGAGSGAGAGAGTSAGAGAGAEGVSSADTVPFPIVYANKAFCMMTHERPENIIGQSLATCLGAGGQEEVLAMLQTALEQQEAIKVMLKCTSRKGPYQDLCAVMPSARPRVQVVGLHAAALSNKSVPSGKSDHTTATGWSAPSNSASPLHSTSHFPSINVPIPTAPTAPTTAPTRAPLTVNTNTVFTPTAPLSTSIPTKAPISAPTGLNPVPKSPSLYSAYLSPLLISIPPQPLPLTDSLPDMPPPPIPPRRSRYSICVHVSPQSAGASTADLLCVDPLLSLLAKLLQ
ncbi:hypothetical protein B484DRAFT_448359 [Ochromonadaceae sp. CCMP2298]|nr:hypothetical protein B484DRAFT_448359 [Ochromonadaceae sp. CCMP2298]